MLDGGTKDYEEIEDEDEEVLYSVRFQTFLIKQNPRLWLTNHNRSGQTSSDLD